MKLCGIVIRGQGRGADLGFPTANIQPEENQDCPEPGIYAGLAMVGLSTHLAAIHIGPRPTFAEAASTIEAHLLDFSGNLYDQTICLDIRRKLRDIEKFDTIEALQQAIADDCTAVRQLLES